MRYIAGKFFAPLKIIIFLLVCTPCKEIRKPMKFFEKDIVRYHHLTMNVLIQL